MKHFKILVLLLSLLWLGKGVAQDLIVTNNGLRLHCKIVKEDSLSIYYILPHQSTTQEISKAEVYRYSINRSPVSRPPAKATAAVTSPTVQTESKPESILIRFSGGLAHPVSDFASSTGGLAQHGDFLQGSIILKLIKYIGVSVTYHYQYHQVNSNAITQQYAVAYPNAGISTTSTKWHIRGFFGGLYLALPIKGVDGLSLFGNAQIGLPNYITPQSTLTGVLNNVNFSIVLHSATSNAVGFLQEFGVSYKLNRWIGASLSASHFSGSAHYTDVYSSSSFGTFRYDSFSQTFESLNLQFGLIFILHEL